MLFSREIRKDLRRTVYLIGTTVLLGSFSRVPYGALSPFALNLTVRKSCFHPGCLQNDARKLTTFAPPVEVEGERVIDVLPKEEVSVAVEEHEVEDKDDSISIRVNRA